MRGFASLAGLAGRLPTALDSSLQKNLFNECGHMIFIGSAITLPESLKEIKPMRSYNYDEFSTQSYDFDTVDGPDIGQKAPGFLLTTTEGGSRNLLDFPGDYLVLEMGSITWPLFQSNNSISVLGHSSDNNHCSRRNLCICLIIHFCRSRTYGVG